MSNKKELGKNAWTKYTSKQVDEIFNFCIKFDTGANYNRSREKLLIFINECEFAFIYPKVFEEYYRAKTQFKCHR